MQFMDKEFIDQLNAQAAKERLAKYSDNLTEARRITTDLLEEAMGIAADLGARADAGTITAILNSLTLIYLSEAK